MCMKVLYAFWSERVRVCIYICCACIVHCVCCRNADFTHAPRIKRVGEVDDANNSRVVRVVDEEIGIVGVTMNDARPQLILLRERQDIFLKGGEDVLAHGAMPVVRDAIEKLSEIERIARIPQVRSSHALMLEFVERIVDYLRFHG